MAFQEPDAVGLWSYQEVGTAKTLGTSNESMGQPQAEAFNGGQIRRLRGR